MSINTKQERLSALNRRLPWYRRFSAFPTGYINKFKRKQVAFLYPIGVGPEDPNDPGNQYGSGLSSLSSLSSLSGIT